MKIIEKHQGKEKGTKSVTIHFLKQGERTRSRTITVQGVEIDEIYEKVLFFLKVIQNTKQFVIEEEVEQNE